MRQRYRYAAVSFQPKTYVLSDGNLFTVDAKCFTARKC